MGIRETLLQAAEIKSGGLGLEPLLPVLPSKKFLEAVIEQLGKYDILVTKPQRQWPEPQDMSIVYGDTLGLVFESQSGIGQAAYVSGFSRGIAALATILNPVGLSALHVIVSDMVPPIAIGDTNLPEVAPWLRRDMLESAVNIVEKTDNYNLIGVLAFNYGLFWATATVVPPTPKGRQKSAMTWVRNIAEHFGSLGVVPE